VVFVSTKKEGEAVVRHVCARVCVCMCVCVCVYVRAIRDALPGSESRSIPEFNHRVPFRLKAKPHK
jgi:hypothetical protein